MRSHHRFLLGVALAIGARAASAQAPRGVEYTLFIDSADLSGVTVDMRILGALSEFRVAMVAHTKYDDQYWRYLTELG